MGDGMVGQQAARKAAQLIVQMVKVSELSWPLEIMNKGRFVRYFRMES